MVHNKSTLGRIRTCDLLIRSQLLYPAELRGHVVKCDRCHNECHGIFLTGRVRSDTRLTSHNLADRSLPA